MRRTDSEKTSQCWPWTLDAVASQTPDEQRPEYQIHAWVSPGTALVGIASKNAGIQATVGADSHPLDDDVFLAGFAIACVLVGLSVYAPVGELIGGSLCHPRASARNQCVANRKAETVHQEAGQACQDSDHYDVGGGHHSPTPGAKNSALLSSCCRMKP
jgi:hypothetical protein